MADTNKPPLISEGLFLKNIDIKGTSIEPILSKSLSRLAPLPGNFLRAVGHFNPSLVEHLENLRKKQKYHSIDFNAEAILYDETVSTIGFHQIIGLDDVIETLFRTISHQKVSVPCLDGVNRQVRMWLSAEESLEILKLMGENSNTRQLILIKNIGNSPAAGISASINYDSQYPDKDPQEFLDYWFALKPPVRHKDGEKRLFSQEQMDEIENLSQYLFFLFQKVIIRRIITS